MEFPRGVIATPVRSKAYGLTEDEIGGCAHLPNKPRCFLFLSIEPACTDLIELDGKVIGSVELITGGKYLDTWHGQFRS